MIIRRGDVVTVDFGTGAGSSYLQTGIRPAVIVQNEEGNRYSPIIFVVPLTTRIKKTNLPVHGVIQADCISGIRADSMFLAEQGQPINRESIINKIGRVSDETMAEIGYALAINQGLLPIRREGFECGQVRQGGNMSHPALRAHLLQSLAQ